MNYIERFEKMGLGLFVHFGLFSVWAKGEWGYHYLTEEEKAAYRETPKRFFVRENWAKELVKTAKETGCKYITLTTRHHDGFSLYDTCGLSDYDAPHSACGRDLIREFVDACREEDIMPFFYHTLLDWYQEDYRTDFPKYMDYLIASVEILCKNYGKIGGLWFDGMWSKEDADWQEDRLYGMIRKYQPEAMIINNTGMSACGQIGHFEIDSVTFERGKPFFVDHLNKHRAGEMCQTLNDHWGYVENDVNYKAIGELIENLVDCRKYNCNCLMNTGPMGDGSLNPMDKAILKQIGKWIHANMDFIYDVKSCDIECKGADLLKGDDGCYYAVVKQVPLIGDPNVVLKGGKKEPVTINAKIKSAEWLDSGEKIDIENGSTFEVGFFAYGKSLSVRIAKITLDA